MDQQNSNLFDLQVDHLVSGYLSEAAKWAKFLAIMGFIFCLLMILVGLFAGTLMGMMGSMMGGGAYSTMGAGFLTFIYLILAAIYFFPCLYLYRFASQAQHAIKNNEQNKFQGSFKNLKACFKFVGILFIILICVYILAFFGFLVGSAYM
jgi:preprotein translocase subunit SecG